VSFRSRILLACLIVAVAPLVVFVLGARRTVQERLTGEYDATVSSARTVVTRDLAQRAETLDSLLSGLAARIDRDPVQRAALLQHGDPATLLDYAGEMMPVTGLDYLLLLDDTATVLSSGHFRNDYDRRVPAFGAPLVPSDPVLVAARRPDGALLALARVHPFTVGERRFLLVGGFEVDSAFVAGLAHDPVTVQLEYPGGSLGAGGDDVALTDTRGVEQLTLPFIDDAGGAASAADAHWTITHSLAPLRAVQRGMDAWFLAAVAGAIVLALGMAHVVSGFVNRPLAALADQATQVHLDHLDTVFETERDDEIGTLSRTLDAMVRRLRGSAARLRDAERRATVGDIARQVNHDIKNGLLPIRNVIRHLAEVAHTTPAQLGEVFTERESTLQGGIGYLESLATRYARLSPPVDRQLCDVNLIIRAALAESAHDPRLRLELSNTAPRVTADPVALRRVVENLAVNALESLDRPNGYVIIRTSLHTTDGDALVSITVADTGAGIEPEKLERIFDDFYTTKERGTGLGLSIVRRLVTDMGGRIRVKSERGVGTTFRVDLPFVA
jgi:signal transduction histidine kinase